MTPDPHSVLHRSSAAVLEAPLEIDTNEMGPLLHIYVGPAFLGAVALCGHRCPVDGPSFRHDPSKRHCAACKDVARREGWLT